MEEQYYFYTIFVYTHADGSRTFHPVIRNLYKWPFAWLERWCGWKKGDVVVKSSTLLNRRNYHTYMDAYNYLKRRYQSTPKWARKYCLGFTQERREKLVTKLYFLPL